MLVQQVQDGTPVAPNQVYIAPPQADVVITNRVVKLLPRSGTPGLHMPIDRFFRSLAEDQGPQAIGIVLSGSGSDGALGLQAIKEHGGLTLVQDERTASFAGMPHSAMMHGSIDVIGAPDGLAQELMQIARHPYVADAPAAVQEVAPAILSDQEAWNRILRLLQRTSGINFTAYKLGTIQRRIARRMALLNLEQLGTYARYLETHRDEIETLYHDLLIKVTTFFRHPESFEALQRDVLPRLMSERPVTRPLRIWVPGCATGEEAYSPAICALEVLGERAFDQTLRLFATDIDELALAKARLGLYIENIVLDVSAERLWRFFVKVDQHYQVSPAVHELCVFARHNLYQDPPFSNLDLISCRNVLIYLESASQRPVIPLFHYALQPAASALSMGHQSPLPKPAPTPSAESDRISRLQQELEATRSYLQSLTEQYEAANEELKAANEEIISSNEELQSTNEELETAKEELQSMNEELLTTNDERWHLNRELRQANNDLSNLFSGVNLPIIMVGHDLRIRRFTAMAETVLQLIPTDIGRPIGHLQLNSVIPELESWILQVIDTVNPQAHEVQDRTGHW